MENVLEQIPEILYKYRPYEGEGQGENFGTRTLLNFELFASSPINFNDPFDIALPYKYTKDSFTLENFISRYTDTYDHNKWGRKSRIELIYDATSRYNYICENPERHWKENADVIYEMDNEFYGILSLSTKPYNMLMWSHYANLHKGYCLGLDGRKFAEFLASKYKDYGFKLGPVKYSSDYPLIDFTKQLEKETTFIRCFTKNQCWGYEDEYRLVFHNKPNEVIAYPKELIKEVHLGCRISEQHKQEIRNFLIENNLDVVKLYQMKVGFESFGLESIPL
ncbi:DUF2971 domain-containing protein [Sphingobacterium corticibacterium]|uniref:DUF2971 domain-containing protein n=1 Tax=Sphingobacterium corticibacterium TaxID=2484746 RepID=A0A4Q6Y024_9SPHI|nr:DUF2971 domain-containing protein [Sphingobacterium corticibacterium]RZF62539.1 DUF2971 domain-containing protein [Sphingobacterium corticibacterium]